MGPTTTYSEPELIAALKAKDQQAFEYLYDHYSGALYSIILQIVPNATPAKDILQEVFINIWRRIDTYDPAKASLFTWMLNISRNAAIDQLRSAGYRNSRKNQELTEGVYGRDQATEINTDRIGLSKFLQKLRPDLRVLLDLSYIRGYTHEEIAQIEDIPLGTVKTRIRSALIQLRALLK